ncbi:MAG: glycosyltransferase, partial [Niabella sp.]
MISIIVSSYKPDLFLQFSQSIEKTIGVPYEIIKIGNPGLMSLAAAYNLGAGRAQCDNLLFVHEDIVFFTKDWGKVFLEKLTLPQAAIIGLAGAVKRFRLPYGYFNGIPTLDYIFVKHNA